MLDCIGCIKEAPHLGTWDEESFVLPFNLPRPEENIEDALEYRVAKGHLHKGSQAVIISSIRTIGLMLSDQVWRACN